MDAYDVAQTFGRAELLTLLLERGAKKRRAQRIKFFWKLCVERLKVLRAKNIKA